jgi:RNA polymerase sigma-70 factor (ECF subfamily)
MDSVEQLFRQHYAFVCTVVHHYVRDRSRTEDIAQEIFAELWMKTGSSSTYTPLSRAYLRRMAVTRALNHIRNSKKHNWEDLDTTSEFEARPAWPGGRNHPENGGGGAENQA